MTGWEGSILLQKGPFWHRAPHPSYSTPPQEALSSQRGLTPNLGAAGGDTSTQTPGGRRSQQLCLQQPQEEHFRRPSTEECTGKTVCPQSGGRFRPDSKSLSPVQRREAGWWLRGLGGETHADPCAGDAGVSVFFFFLRDYLF